VVFSGHSGFLPACSVCRGKGSARRRNATRSIKDSDRLNRINRIEKSACETPRCFAFKDTCVARGLKT
jgi:hypothetical protein